MYLSVNFKDIDSYNKILKIFNKVENISVPIYNIKSKYSKEFINENEMKHIKYLEQEVYDKYKNELQKVLDIMPKINSQKQNEIQPIFNEMNYTAKRKIFSYLYWKYRNENSDEKINIIKLKKVMGFGHDGKENFIEPFRISMVCSKCNGNGSIYIYNYELENVSYECFTCGHKQKSNLYNKFDILFNCNCKNCIEIKKELYYVLKENLKNLNEDLKIELKNRYLETNDDTIPSEEQMEKDYRLYRSDLTATEREVLSFHPKSIDELYKVIKSIDVRNANYSGKKLNILSKLIEHKVVYIIKDKISKDKLEELLKNEIIKNNIEIHLNNNLITDCANKNKFLDKLYNELDKINFDKFNNIYKGKLKFEFDGILIEFKCPLYQMQYLVDLTVQYFHENIIINNNYIKEEIIINDINELKEKKLIHSIFRSSKESNVYWLLINKYKNYIVIPNCHFRDAIDVDFFYQILRKEECEYLKKCILDFVICDKEGYILKVIELQRGNHHNDPDWISKDNIKKRALKILGIEFEEYY